MTGHIKYKHLLYLVAIGFCLQLYVDHLVYLQASRMIAYAILATGMAVSLFKFSSAVNFTASALILSPYFPRFIYSLYATGNQYNKFYTIYTVMIAHISIAQIMVVWLALIGLIRILSNRYQTTTKTNGLLPWLLLIASLLAGLCFVNTNPVKLRDIIFDIRLPSIMAMCYIIVTAYGNPYKNEPRLIIDSIIKNLTFVGIITGARAIFLIISAPSALSNLVLYTNTTLFLPILLATLFTKQSKSIPNVISIILLTIASIPNGRGDIATMAIILITFAFVMLFDKHRSATNKALMILTPITTITLSLILLTYIDPKIVQFMSYKLGFFTKILNGNATLSHSPLVRLYELSNIIISNLKSGIAGILFGQGAGGSFNFSTFRLPFSLSAADYSKVEIASNLFTKPHSFANFFLLKSGVIGLLSYISIMITPLLLTFKTSIRNNHKIRTAKYVIIFATFGLLYSGYWQTTLLYTFFILFFAIGMEYTKNRELA